MPEHLEASSDWRGTLARGYCQRLMHANKKPWRLSYFLGLVLWTVACGPDGAPHARVVIRETHAREVKSIVMQDIARHLRGVSIAGSKLARGFAVEDANTRRDQMRSALRLLTRPPKGIQELIGSARTFVAAVDPSGLVIATDAQQADDRMTGVRLKFPVLREALGGKTGYAVDQFEALEKGAEGSVSLLFAAPSVRDTQVAGAVLTGIPLWRLAQRLTKQLQLDHAREKGTILWAYVLKGDSLHRFGTPPDLDSILPDASVRRAGLAASPGGFTGELIQFGRWYAYGILPIRALGPDISVMIVRSDPV